MNKKLNEETEVDDIATPEPTNEPDATHAGFPCFNVGDDSFWKMHGCAKREPRQWSKTWTGNDMKVANWARSNPGKPFFIKGDNGMMRMIKK